MKYNKDIKRETIDGTKKSKYEIRSSSLPNDTNLANEMFRKGYKCFQIVPWFFSDGSCGGYTYWFETIVDWDSL